MAADSGEQHGSGVQTHRVRSKDGARFLEGFDSYTYTDFGKKWQFVGTATNSNQLTTGRYGGQCYVTAAYSGVQTFSRTFDNKATWVVGCAIKMTQAIGSQPLIYWYDTANTGAAQVSLWLNNNIVQVNRQSSTLLGISSRQIAMNSWTYVEWKVTIDGTTGSFEVRVNGDTYISASGVNTRGQTTNNWANMITFPVNYNYLLIDDIYVVDTTGSINNDFLGDIRVATLLPSGAGSNTTWTPSTGANYACVDETLINNDTDYVSTTVVGNIDTYAYADLPANTTAVKGVQTNLGIRKDDAGYRQACAVVRSGGTNYPATAVGLSDSYVYQSDMWETDPATGVAWTPTGVNNMEAGAKVTA